MSLRPITCSEARDVIHTSLSPVWVAQNHELGH